jgi:radical SAM superfamily enzyme YgiQ (UPF0313 family)
MKVALIKPPMPFGWTPVAPPVLEYLGALTMKAMPDVDLRLIDGSATPVYPKGEDVDLVGISCLTATAVPGYRIADGLRKDGIPVIIGGLHASALPDEAKQHADAVVVGEAESVWTEVLEDAKKGIDAALRPSEGQVSLSWSLYIPGLSLQLLFLFGEAVFRRENTSTANC